MKLTLYKMMYITQYLTTQVQYIHIKTHSNVTPFWVTTHKQSKSYFLN
jgi:hypothetical protein